MQHELQPDSLVDLKFIMADTGFGKTFIYDRIKSGEIYLHPVKDRFGSTLALYLLIFTATG